MSLQHTQLIAIAFTALACSTQPPAEAPKQVTSEPTKVAEGDWVLLSLGTQAMPADSTRRPTLRLNSATLRASGFAGCNRYSGAYTVQGDSLAFGPIAATKMFCDATSALENAFLAALGATTTFQLSDSTLTLRTKDGVEARFKPAAK